MDDKEQLYTWFSQEEIKTRKELRDKWGIAPATEFSLKGAEGIFAQYKKEKSGKIEPEKNLKVVTINDLHVPYHNEEMIRGFIKLLEEEQPDEIILKGDMVDFYDLSSFDKNPDRVNRLQEELDILYRILLVMRASCPNTKIVYIMGNHEDRLRRYLWKNAIALSSLRALKFEELLKLDELEIELVEHSYFIGDFEFTHGEVVRQHSSYSAKAEYDRRGGSGCMGHVHRMGCFCKTTSRGTFGWWEDGCACDLNPEYVAGTPNWQNGFSVIYFDDNAYDVHPVYVNKGKFRYNGTKY